MGEVTMLTLHKFFKGDGVYTLKQFRADWAELTDEDKAQLKAGIGDGTFNY